jgi:NAD+ synthetase
MKIALAQINPTIGDFDANCSRIVAQAKAAAAQGAQLTIFSEMCVMGYPARDMLEKPAFLIAQDRAIERLKTELREIPVVLGIVMRREAGKEAGATGRPLYNSCVLLVDGQVKALGNKSLLPTYDVFDEDRYFQPAAHPELAVFKGKRFGLTICEDAWNDKDYWRQVRKYDVDPVEDVVSRGAEILINISASPYNIGKQPMKEQMLAAIARKHSRPLLYVNQVGGNDDLIFDGRSLAFAADGTLLARGPAFEEGVTVVDLDVVVPASAPAGMVPASAPDGVVPASAPAGVVPASVPAGVVPASAPAGVVPASAPAGMVPASAPAGMVPASAPASADPPKPFRQYRRCLPHWRLEGAYYFVSWRLATNEPELSPDERSFVVSALLHFNALRYALIAYVVMSDHVHAIVQPFEEHSLESVLHSWKSYTANRMQRETGRSGAVWEREYYDRILRNDAEFYEKLNYIQSNPFKRWPDLKDYKWLAFLAGTGPVSAGTEAGTTLHGSTSHLAGTEAGTTLHGSTSHLAGTEAGTTLHGSTSHPAGAEAGTTLLPALSTEEEVHRALVLGTRDYARKCGFKSAVLGLSGGIDSALVGTIAAEAFGPENVLGVALPSRFNAPESLADAQELAKRLGIHFDVIPIEDLAKSYKGALTPIFAGRKEDVTEENLQARIRGVLLMALSNKFCHLLLTTGNKSELATGYCTLYGDMCGGLAVISDLYKTMVYRVSRHLNAINPKNPPIPESCITKAPTAELRFNQCDQDTLPPYEILDGILKATIEEQKTAGEIVALGYDEKIVRQVLRMLDVTEYKRRQAPPGLKVTVKAFGTGRRMPIAQRFRE